MTAAPMSLDPHAGVRASRRACALAVTLAVMGMAVAVLGLSQSASAAVSPSQQWLTNAAPNITASGGVMNLVFGSSGVNATMQSAGNTTVNFPFLVPGPIGNYGNTPPFIEPDSPADSVMIQQGVNGGAPPINQTIDNVITFNKPVISPILHVINLDGSYLDVLPSTTTGAPITTTALAKNDALEFSGTFRWNNTPEPGSPAGSSTCDEPAAPSNGGCGSIQLGVAGNLIRSFAMHNVGSASGDSWLWALSFPTAPLTKQFSPARIPVGGTSQLTFTITNPANPGQVDLSPLDFTDVLPEGLTVAAGTPLHDGCGGSPTINTTTNSVSASNLSVAVGATCTITINVTASEPSSCYRNDNGNLSTGVANLVPAADTCLEVTPRAEVEIVKSSTSALVPGREATYVFTMKNKGPSPAVNEVATDDLPSGVSFVSASDGCSEAGGTVTCTAPGLAVGETKRFEVRVRVNSSANSCQQLRNKVTITGDIEDPEPINNESEICNFKIESDLKLRKDPSSATVAPGGQVMYTMVVENLGPSDDTNVTVKDPIPEGLTLQSAKPAQGSCSIAGGDLSCNLGSLKAGGSTQILVTATMDKTSGCVVNTARVGGDAYDPTPANNTDDARVCVEGQDPRFDVVVSKSVNKKNPLVGETVRYRVVVSNRGPDTAPSVTVKDTLNAPVDVVSVRASQGSCTKRIPMTCELGTIPAGGRVTITIRARHLEPASGDCSRRGQRNAASATADGTDTNPANNLDVARVCPKVKLRLTKTASATVVRAGGTLSYTIRTHNPAKVAVRNVRTCDRLPAGLVFVSATPKAKLSRGQHCWTAKAIGAGKSKTYRVTVRALSGASGRLLNTASASSPHTRTNRVRRPVQVLGQQVDPPQPTG